MKNHSRIAVVQYHGIFHKHISLFEAVALIISGTIGAGVLGLPYAVSQSGLGIGILSILGLGFLLMGLNMLLGEISIRAGMPLQLAGLAKKYLGAWGEMAVGGIVYTSVLGVLVVYIIGEGTGLAALFGGSSFVWSTLFFLVATVCVFSGIQMIKKIQMILTLGILLVVAIVSMASVRHISFDNVQYLNLGRALFPYGVVLFSLHGTMAVPQAYSLLRDKKKSFKRAIAISSGIVMAVYILFAIAVVGVTGTHTTEIATVGLGQAIGPFINLFGNLFAVLAMGMGFLSAGLSLSNSLTWDFHVQPAVAALGVCVFPYILFVLGMRSFIASITLVGGVFMSVEMFFLVLIYMKASREHRAIPGYSIHHTWAFLSVFILALSVGAVYSIATVL